MNKRVLNEIYAPRMHAPILADIKRLSICRYFDGFNNQLFVF